MVYFQQSVYETLLENWKSPLVVLFKTMSLHYKFFPEEGIIFFYYKTSIKGTEKKLTKERKQFTSPFQKIKCFFFFFKLSYRL